MKILAIETSTPASSVALGEDDAVRAMSVNVDGRGHVGFLMPAIDFCLNQAGWKAADIDLVAVDVGPGPYTGLRAGIATAQAFAAAVGAQMAPVSSLTAIGLRAATGRRRIWPVVDMKRGQFAVAPFQPLPGGVAPDGEPEVVNPQELKATLKTEIGDALVVGDWQARQAPNHRRFRRQFDRRCEPDARGRPHTVLADRYPTAGGAFRATMSRRCGR